MSQSSSRSASSSQGSCGAGYGGQGSPLKYNVGPLAYAPEVRCKCRSKSCRWTSWSDDNPARRYYRCMKARLEGDCGFFLWADEECSAWYKQVLRELRDAVWGLKKELAVKDKEVEDKLKVLALKEKDLVAKEMQLVEKQAKEEDVKALQAQLKNKNQCIDKLILLCVLLLMTMIVILFNGK